MNKLIPIVVAAAVVVGAFYGGMQYAESKGSQGGFSRADLQNLSPEERQQRFQGFGASVSGGFDGNHEGEGGDDFRGRFGSGINGFRSLSGEIISQSNDSFTIKLSDGSTRIVFVGKNTQIIKSVNGALDDLSEGEQVFVSGDENPDGSYTAQTIQLSPLNQN